MFKTNIEGITMDTSFNWDQIYNDKYRELTREGMSHEEAHEKAVEHANGLQKEHLSNHQIGNVIINGCSNEHNSIFE